MAAPTNVRVEAESITSVTLRWSYAGTAPIQVYRSTDGVTYTALTTGIVLPGTTEFTDTDLASATKYWYKLSDDSGSTFSSVVTVITHTCAGSTSQDTTQIIPRASGNTVDASTFNTLADRVETSLTRFVSPDGKTCVACISDGALVIDCVNYTDCDTIEITTTENVNSISLPNCENNTFTLKFLVPPNTTVGVGGWPKGIGFTGDEGYRAPLSGGLIGRTFPEAIIRGMNENGMSGRSKPGISTAGTPTGGLSRNTGSCTCTPGSNGELTIKACTLSGGTNPTNSLGCLNASQGLYLLVCGGRGPYTWSNTGSVVRDKDTGTKIKVTPPTNSGSGVAGTAYQITGYNCNACFSTTCAAVAVDKKLLIGCDDVVDTCGDSSTTDACSPSIPAASSMKCHDGVCSAGQPSCTVPACPDSGMGNLVTSACDARTAGMISNGCNPCGVQAGATVSVTDALGTVTTVVLRA